MVEKIKSIYQIKSKETGKCYIGSTNDYRLREMRHRNSLKARKHHSKILQFHVNKYGFEDLEFEILEVVESESNLIEREQFYMDKIKPQFNVRLIAESNLGWHHSEESKEKISRNNAKNALGRPVSKETREKLSIAHTGSKRTEEQNKARSERSKGEGNPSFGKKASAETIEKLRQSHLGLPNKLKGIPRTEETKKKISEANKGHVKSEETLRKMSESMMGKNKKGNPHSDETKEKLRITSTGKNHTEESKQKMVESWKIRKQKKAA